MARMLEIKTQTPTNDAINGNPFEGQAAFPSPLHAALAHIRERYGSRITLKCLESVTGATSFQLIRAFRRHLGTTPHSFIIQYRVARGTRMLEDGETAAAIAADLGFVDQSHFIRHFKRQHGCSPGPYLKASREPGFAGLSLDRADGPDQAALPL